MSEPSTDRDPFEVVAESFLERFRAGQRPSIEEFAACYPELADQIRDLLPALVMVEQDLTVDRNPDPTGPPFPPSRSSFKGWRLGDYRILREIGRGGMGVVYEAEQLSLGRRVALKILSGHLAGDGTGVERFRREAKAAARLHHTNIVPVFEVGREGEVPYYVMQFIRGQGLDQIFEELRRLREPAREAEGHDPDPFEDQEQKGAVTDALPRVDAPPSNLPGPALTQMTGMLLTGVLARGSAVSGLAWTEQFDPAATSDRLPDAPKREDLLTPTPTAPSPSPSAVLPGGKHVSDIDTSGRRRPYFRSVAQIGRQAAQGLAYAHARGIVHRDIKPSNLLLDTEGVVWITDFGLAKADDDGLTASGDILGTLRYMAPERFRGEGDARADVYALGLTLYELLTLRPAYDSTDRLRLIERIKNEEPVRPRSIDPQIPRDLQTIVLKAIDKHPDHRYSTAEALAEDLRRFLADEPIKARQISTSERYWRWARRNPAVATLVGLVSALLVLATIGSLVALARISALADRDRLMASSERSAHQTADRARLLAQQAEEEMRKYAAEADAGKLVAERETRRAEAEKRRAEEQLTRSEWLVYSGKLMLAQNNFESGNGGLASHYLDECQANLRGWEFRHLWGRINARQTLSGHSGGVTSAAFSPDGSRIVTGSIDGTARVWDAATAEPVLTLKGHRGYVYGVAFSPDGSRIVTGGGEYSLGKSPGEVNVWDAVTGRRLLRLVGHSDNVWAVAFSPDGSRIITGSGDRSYGQGEAKIWDSATGREVLTLEGYTDNTRCLAYRPDGRQFVTGAPDGRVRFWDASTGKEVLTIHSQLRVRSLAFSNDGARVVTGHDEGMSKVWDSSTGREVLSLKGHGFGVESVAFSPDGSRIVTGNFDQTTKVWDGVTGQELFTLKGHSSHVPSASFSPDGRRILTGSEDGTAKVWEAETGQEVPILQGHADFVSGIAFSPDSARIVTSSGDGSARVWDATTARQLLILKHAGVVSRSEKGRLYGAAFSPDGRRIVTGGGDAKAKVWDATTGGQLLSLDHSEPVLSVAFSPDGRRIATATAGENRVRPGEVKVWDVETGLLCLTIRHGPGFRSVQFSPDGTRILAGTQDHQAKLWDTATGRESLALHGHAGDVTSVAFRRDGRRILTGSTDRTARVWDAANGQEILSLKGHTEPLTSVAFSPDGERIVTGSHDRSAKVWDSGTGQELLAFQGQPEAVMSVAFSPDGQRIVTGIAGADATASVWSAGRGQEVLVLEGRGEMLVSVAFSPDDKRIFGWDTQKRILAWSATGGRPIDPLNPPAMPSPGPTRSADGFLQARPEGKTIVITDERPSPRDNAWPLPDAAQWELHRAEHARRLRLEGIEQAQSLMHSGYESFEQGRFAESNVSLQRVSELLQAARKDYQGDPVVAQLLGECHGWLSSTQRALKRPGEALAHCRKSLDAYESLANPDLNSIYNMACDYAVMSELDGVASSGDREKLEARAVEYLRKAIANDTAEVLRVAATDRDLDPLRRRVDFRDMMADASFPSDPFTQPSPIAIARETPAVRKIKGEAFIAEGHTLEAIPQLASAWRADPRDHLLLLKVAALQAWFRCDAELAATCRAAREFAGHTVDAGPADATAKSSSLRPPDDPAYRDATLALARSAHELGKDSLNAGWYRMGLGIAEYRSGHDEAAAETLRTLIGDNSQVAVTSAFYLAMSFSRQGKDAEAHRVATEAIAKMRPLPLDEDNPLAGGANHDDLILWMAYKEARISLKLDGGSASPPRR